RVVGVAAALAWVSLAGAGSAHAAELTGAWRGTVTLDGQKTRFTATFSEDGYFLFTYTVNGGVVRSLAVSRAREMQVAAPGGGTMTVVVESVVTRPAGVTYKLRTGFERQTGSEVERQYMAEEADYALTADGLRVRIVSWPASSLEDQSGSGGRPPG